MLIGPDCFSLFAIVSVQVDFFCNYVLTLFRVMGLSILSRDVLLIEAGPSGFLSANMFVPFLMPKVCFCHRRS
jgi:hypothetical protein